MVGKTNNFISYIEKKKLFYGEWFKNILCIEIIFTINCFLPNPACDLTKKSFGNYCLFLVVLFDSLIP